MLQRCCVLKVKTTFCEVTVTDLWPSLFNQHLGEVQNCIHRNGMDAWIDSPKTICLQLWLSQVQCRRIMWSSRVFQCYLLTSIAMVTRVTDKPVQFYIDLDKTKSTCVNCGVIKMCHYHHSGGNPVPLLLQCHCCTVTKATCAGVIVNATSIHPLPNTFTPTGGWSTKCACIWTVGRRWRTWRVLVQRDEVRLRNKTQNPKLWQVTVQNHATLNTSPACILAMYNKSAVCKQNTYRYQESYWMLSAIKDFNWVLSLSILQLLMWASACYSFKYSFHLSFLCEKMQIHKHRTAK